MRAAVDLRRGSSGTIAWLSGEPSAHVFLFKGAAEYVWVDIIYIPNEAAEDPWEGAERRWAGSLRVEEITQAAMRMAQAVWDEHGEAGYLQLWDGTPFPREELLILRGERP